MQWSFKTTYIAFMIYHCLGLICHPFSALVEAIRSISYEIKVYKANDLVIFDSFLIINCINRMLLISQYFRFFYFQSPSLPNCAIPCLY